MITVHSRVKFWRYTGLLCLLLLTHVTDAASFKLFSPGLFHGQTVATKYTCVGEDISPALSWYNVPANTKSFVVIVKDPDAPGGIWYHWLLYNIPADVTRLPEGMPYLPKGAVEGYKSWSQRGYNGPCPSRGQTHHYIYMVYALDIMLPTDKSLTPHAVYHYMQGHILAENSIHGVFGR